MFKEGLKSGKVKKYKKSNHLTFKQKLFADEYLSNNGNGTQAALKAYSTTYATADVIARENLEKPRIKSYLAEKLRHKDLKKEDVINKLIL